MKIFHHLKRQNILCWIRTAFVGFLFGYLLAILISCSIWLEMRLNSGIVIPLSTGIFLLIGSPYCKALNFKRLMGFECFVIILFMVRYNFQLESLPVVPAILLREGTSMNFISIGQINMILVLIIFIGNLAWISKKQSP